ncbi:AlkA N-terminal domain-containing protein [Arthrobacter sp. H5]|uniref:AlkA N-terminal domain-containing protein n=1 Tax=Arthrobacter sp. H5 TaxID=1267973 RepID=UPI0004AF9681|nr:AlkA N-terminal domain-containing protein [Arthrobacter sp. H5]
MDFWQRYRAIDSRDTRFDGQFVTAVATTRIYCRPSCPARTPKPANVTFYSTSAAAHEAGYRACKRCLPEAVPGTPDWNLRSDTAARAMRLISDGEVDRHGVPGLAARLGYSTRQLGRILSQELGAGPLALARASRAQTARALLTATELKYSDIAFASGFNSIRQFNETVQEVFDLSPSQLRERSRMITHPEAGAGPHTALSLTLPLRRPYDRGIFDFLRVRSVDGVEQAGADTYSRLVRLPGGEGWFSARHGAVGLDVSVMVEKLKDLPVLLSRIRRLFDLDADPEAIDSILCTEPRMAERIRLHPGIRLPGAMDPQEILIRAMIGQQITVGAATTGLNRLAELGAPSALNRPGLNRLFPTPAALAEGAGSLLKGPARRTSSILRVAEALADGSLHIGVEDSPAELAEKLLPLPGIGPWTVRYVAMRVLGATDIHLGNDAAVRNGWARLTGAAGSPPEASTLLEQFSPWRSYATMHLWRLAAKKTVKAPTS